LRKTVVGLALCIAALAFAGPAAAHVRKYIVSPEITNVSGYNVVTGLYQYVAGDLETVKPACRAGRTLSLYDASGLLATTTTNAAASALLERNRARLARAEAHLSRVGEELCLWASSEFGFIRLADEEQILMLNMHHIATDGYSRSAIYGQPSSTPTSTARTSRSWSG